MSSKENVAVHQLLALLEARYALRVLWSLRDGHAQTFRLLQDSVGGITPNTLNTRIKELREAELLTHGSDGYILTPSGTDLLKRLNDLQAFAGKWTVAQAKKAAARQAEKAAEKPGEKAAAHAVGPGPVSGPAGSDLAPAPSAQHTDKPHH